MNKESTSENAGISKDSGDSGKTAGNPPVRAHQNIKFSGTAREYFGIWIVNLILSIITLGIYSAWAKVRRETYFKNNTKILNSGFGYHATGGQILKGRLIVFAVLVIVQITYSFLPDVGLALSFVFLFLIPWLLNSSMRFSARMTSYRNVRFNWHGTYWKTLWFLIIAPVLGWLTLGLLTPLISKSYYSYVARSYSYGTTKFVCKPTVSEYYFAFFVGVILPTVLITILFVGLSVLMIGSVDLSGLMTGFVGIIVAITTFMFSMLFIYPILCRNLMMKSLLLSDVATFNSKISPIRFVWISLSNMLAIIVSIGLLLPWAKVRIYSYLVRCTEINIDGDMEKFIDDELASRASFGEELAEFEGVSVEI